MDPQHRLLCESASESFSPSGVGDRRVAVYVGMVSSSYAATFPETAGTYSATGQQPSAAVGRVSFTFGCVGPAVAVDTACSSSLVALRLAFADLRFDARGEDVRAALVGGAHLTLAPDQTRLCHLAGMLSPDGRCKTLDAAADGYVRGEAAQTTTANVDARAFGDDAALVALRAPPRIKTVAPGRSPSRGPSLVVVASRSAAETNGASVGGTAARRGTASAIPWRSTPGIARRRSRRSRRQRPAARPRRGQIRRGARRARGGDDGLVATTQLAGESAPRPPRTFDACPHAAGTSPSTRSPSRGRPSRSRASSSSGVSSFMLGNNARSASRGIREARQRRSRARTPRVRSRGFALATTRDSTLSTPSRRARRRSSRTLDDERARTRRRRPHPRRRGFDGIGARGCRSRARRRTNGNRDARGGDAGGRLFPRREGNASTLDVDAPCASRARGTKRERRDSKRRSRDVRALW